MFTGRVVALIGVTLAAGVITWALSPIKFQGRHGYSSDIYVSFGNMIGALILMPALAHFLLKPKAVEELVAQEALSRISKKNYSPGLGCSSGYLIDSYASLPLVTGAICGLQDLKRGGVTRRRF